MLEPGLAALATLGAAVAGLAGKAMLARIQATRDLRLKLAEADPKERDRLFDVLHQQLAELRAEVRRKDEELRLHRHRSATQESVIRDLQIASSRDSGTMSVLAQQVADYKALTITLNQSLSWLRSRAAAAEQTDPGPPPSDTTGDLSGPVRPIRRKG